MLDQTDAPAFPPFEVEALETAGEAGLWRTGPVPMYSSDALVRRAPALQQTNHAQNGFAALNPATAESLGFSDGDEAIVRQAGSEVRVPLRLDGAVPPSSIWMAAATCLASQAGPAWGPVEVEQAR